MLGAVDDPQYKRFEASSRAAVLLGVQEVGRSKCEESLQHVQSGKSPNGG